MTEENKNPGTEGEGAFFGSAGAPPNSTATAAPAQPEGVNGTGSLDSLQMEARDRVKEKHGVDIFSDTIFAEAEKFVGEDAQLKGFYTEQKENEKNFIRRTLDSIFEFAEKVNIKDEQDRLARSTGTMLEYYTSRKKVPTTKYESDMNETRNMQRRTAEVVKVYKNKINTLEEKCRNLHSRSENAKNVHYQEAKRALQAEREKARLENEKAKILNSYQAGKISYEKQREEQYNLEQEIMKQEGVYRVANLAMTKEKIVQAMSEKSEWINRCILQDFYYIKLNDTLALLEKVNQLYSLMSDMSDVINDINSGEILEDNNDFKKEERIETNFMNGVVYSIEGMLNYAAKKSQHRLNKGGAVEAYKTRSGRLLKDF